MDEGYSEQLLFSRRLGGAESPPSSGDENPQEAGLAMSSSPSDLHRSNLLDGASLPSAAVGHNDGEGETFVQKYLGRIIAAVLALGLAVTVFFLLPYYAVHAASNNKWNETLYWTSGAFVLIAVPVSAHGIVLHLVNYYMPQVQKYVIRILFMVPIFSIQAWFSLCFHSATGYVRAFRELYEAFVLSSFVYYIIELLGGEDQLANTLRTKDSHYGRHPFPFPYLCKDWQMGRQFMMNCKYGVLQYVLIKTLSTIVVIVLQSMGRFETGNWAWDSAYTYISVILNVSIGYALYCLVKLYYTTKDDLKEWNPVWKFLCIKGIIFFTFWQGFLIQVLHSAGVITGVGEWDSEHVVDGLQDFLITFEMVFFAVAHRYAFPHTDYIHYLQRHVKQSRSSRRRRGQEDSLQSEETETLFVFDQDHNVVHGADGIGDVRDVEYEPPTVRQLDRPMSVSRALMGAVPTETISDIARMSMGEGGRRSGGGLSEGSDIVISREHAEGI